MDPNDRPQPSQSNKEVNGQENASQNQPQAQGNLVNFYSAETSPFMRASPRLKQLLLKYKQNQKLNIDALNMDDVGYEVRKTKNNICSKFFSVGQKYYNCKECSTIQDAGMHMCLCQSCFDPLKHSGHAVTQSLSASGDAFCDCGRVNSVKKQCLCEMHSTYYEQLQCEINEEQKQQFIKTFTVLLDCAMYLQKDKKLYQKICKYLCKLNETSIYYNRLTYEVLIINSQSLFAADKAELNIISCYYIMFSCYCLTNKLIIHMSGDMKTRKLFIKFVCKILWNLGEMGVNLIQKFLPENYFSELFDITAILQLLEEGFTNPTFEIMLAKKGQSEQHHKALHLYMDIKISGIKQLKQIFSIKTELIKGDTALKLLTKLIKLYPTNQAINKQTLQLYGQLENQKQILLPQDIKTTNILILKLALMISVNSLHQMTQIRKKLKGFVSANQLDRILMWILPTVKHILTSEVSLGQYICISVFLLLAKGSLFEKQIISKLWNMMFKSAQSQNQKQLNQNKGILPNTQIHIFSDIFMKFTTILINTQIYRILQKKKSFISQNKQKMSPDQEETMSDWLKGFFYARKIIKKEIIIQMKLGGIFDFKDASKILNQFCTYDSRQDLFYYTSPQKFESILYKFPFVISKENYNVIYSIRIHYGMEQNLPENSLPKMLLQLAFSSQNIIPQIDAEWQRYLKSGKKNDGKFMYGYLYLFVLVAYDIFTHGKNKDLRERLQIIRSDESYLEKYSNKEEQIKLMKKLLNMEKKQQTPKKQQQMINIQWQNAQNQQQNEQQQQIQQNSENVMVDKSSQNKSIKIISPVKSPSKQKVQQKQQDASVNWNQMCAICKQKQKPSNELAFMGLINKNSTGCSAVYGKNSLANTTLMTCFHKIHANCYASVSKSQIFVFECPICKTVRNCILPVRYAKQNERLNKMSSNSIILSVLAIYSVFDVEDQFMLIFKHLVEQGGLRAILMYNRSEQSREQWDTINMYMRVLMVDMYKHAGQKGQRMHVKHIDEFIQQIKACEKVQCRQVQLLLADIYKSVIIRKQDKINIQLVKQIREALPEHQFNAIKTQLQKITMDPLLLDAPTESQKDQLKIPIGFYLLRLPKTAQQLAQKYLNRKCENDDKQQATCICLICQKLICAKCRPKHFSEYHSDITVCFSLQGLRVEFCRMNCPTNYQIYYNEYMMSIEEGIKHKMSDTEYILDEPKYEKILRTYLYI